MTNSGLLNSRGLPRARLLDAGPKARLLDFAPEPRVRLLDFTSAPAKVPVPGPEAFGGFRNVPRREDIAHARMLMAGFRAGPEFDTMDVRYRDGEPPLAGRPQYRTLPYDPERDGPPRAVPLSAPAAPPARASSAGGPPPPKSPWRDIDKEMLTNILYNEQASLRGDPQKLEKAMWDIATVIMNRQAAGMEEDFYGKEPSLAPPVISEKERAAIKNRVPAAVNAYNMASGIADLITSAPEAFPARWTHKHYNHRPNDSKAPNPNFGPSPVMEQTGPFSVGGNGVRYLNIFK